MKFADKLERLSKIPGSRLWIWLGLRKTVPYSASIWPDIKQVKDGHCIVHLKDRRGIRNHLNSIHAVALMNLCELCSGLSVLSALPEGVKGIPVKFSIEFKKKARGLLVCDVVASPPAIKERQEYLLDIDVKDQAGDVVCTARVSWLLQPGVY